MIRRLDVVESKKAVDKIIDDIHNVVYENTKDICKEQRFMIQSRAINYFINLYLHGVLEVLKTSLDEKDEKNEKPNT